jgi:hypothetical protein
MRVFSRWSLALMMFLVGCAGLFQGLRPVEEEQGRQVLEALRQKESAINTLRGLFQASISGTGVPFSQKFQGMFSYVQPDVVHLKGFIRLGVPIMDFHREGNHYELSFPTEGKVVTGRVDEAQKSTQWDHIVMLSIRALDAVLGKISGLSQGNIRVWKTADRYRLDFIPHQTASASAQEEFTVRTWVDAQTLEVMSIEYRRSFDEIVLFVECEDYREVKVKIPGGVTSVRLPFLVRATDYRSGGGSISLAIQEYIVNAGEITSVRGME